MSKVKNLQVVGGVVAIGLTVTIYLSHYKRKQDRMAGKLLTMLTQKLHPASKGLAAEHAFDIHYKERVLSTIPRQIAILKESTARRWAKELHSGFKPWYMDDKEEVIYNVLRNLKDKVQVSQMAKAYQDLYKVNLIEELRNRFNTKEIKKALAIVGGLPPYRTL